MKNKHSAYSGVLLSVIVFTGFFAFVIAEENTDTPVSERKIVVFKEGVSDAEKADVLVRASTVRIKKLRHGEAIVSADKDVEAKIAKDKRVAYIEPDYIVEAVDIKVDAKDAKKVSAQGTSSQPVQVLPWGINKIDAEQVWPLGNTATGTDVGIIDTGISTSHPDLAANIKGGVSEVWYTSSYNDDNGHGSHVAGIVGAINNTVGVVGAGPGVNLYAIKVLDRNGSGYLSDVISGIDWATANKMKVINMSLGCNCPSQAMHDAIIRAYKAGVTIVAAAGNSGGSVIYPAAYPEVIAVGATDSSNDAPWWSSRGPEVDLAAPGVSIYSTYKGTKYATLSGTSMASPHVAGSAALLLKTSITPAYDANNNGVWDPSEVLLRLEDSVTDLGPAGRDDVYGFGLVNALAAVSL